MRFSFLLIIASLLISSIAHAENIIAYKPTHVKWSDTDFTYSGNRLQFNDSNEFTIIGVEYAYRFENNFSAGVEYIYYEVDIASNTNLSTGEPEGFNGYANVYHQNIYLKYYFGQSDRIWPYAGVGLGKTRISIHSTPNVIMEGSSYTSNLGIIFRMGGLLGLSLDFKRSYTDVKNAYGHQLKTHEDILQLGLNFIF